VYKYSERAKCVFVSGPGRLVCLIQKRRVKRKRVVHTKSFGYYDDTSAGSGEREFRLWWWYQLFIAVNRNLGIRKRDKYGYGEGEVEKGPACFFYLRYKIPLKLISMVIYIFLNIYMYTIFYMVFLFDKFKENLDKSKTCKTIYIIGIRQVSKIVKIAFAPDWFY